MNLIFARSKRLNFKLYHRDLLQSAQASSSAVDSRIMDIFDYLKQRLHSSNFRNINDRQIFLLGLLAVKYCAQSEKMFLYQKSGSFGGSSKFDWKYFYNSFKN